MSSYPYADRYPVVCFSFTSDVFDIYRVNDAMKACRWRLDGQQYPNAIHMAVTGSQTQPGGGRRARPRHRDEPARSASVGGGLPEHTPQGTAMINAFVEAMLDEQQDFPPA